MGFHPERPRDGAAPDGVAVLGVPEAPGVPGGPVLAENVSPLLGPSQVPVERGLSGLGAGLLQVDVLTQLISAVIVGVAPIAKVAFSPPSEKDPKDADGASGFQKLKEVVHALPWGVTCGTVTGTVGGVSGGDSPMPSGDVAMPLGEHLLQATREKILRSEYVDFFRFFIGKWKRKIKTY